MYSVTLRLKLGGNYGNIIITVIKNVVRNSYDGFSFLVFICVLLLHHHYHFIIFMHKDPINMRHFVVWDYWIIPSETLFLISYEQWSWIFFEVLLCKQLSEWFTLKLQHLRSQKSTCVGHLFGSSTKVKPLSHLLFDSICCCGLLTRWSCVTARCSAKIVAPVRKCLPILKRAQRSRSHGAFMTERRVRDSSFKIKSVLQSSVLRNNLDNCGKHNLISFMLTAEF